MKLDGLVSHIGYKRRQNGFQSKLTAECHSGGFTRGNCAGGLSDDGGLLFLNGPRWSKEQTSLLNRS
jgi:hypothetical protein